MTARKSASRNSPMVEPSVHISMVISNGRANRMAPPNARARPSRKPRPANAAAPAAAVARRSLTLAAELPITRYSCGA